MNPIGIMQGRLSPPPADRIQAFPWSSWEEEFPRARSLGFDCIEWIFEVEDSEMNPLWTAAGRRGIRELVDAYGVAVRSVCADYFMPRPFFRVTPAERQRSIDVLLRLIEHTAAVGARLILIPVLEIAEIREPREADELEAALAQCVPTARTAQVRLGLETELPAPDYVGLIERIGDPAVGAYYDIGNAAARGYDGAADVRALGPSICGVHVKDRILDGGTVPLGKGAADLPGVLGALHDVGYDGTLVLQTAFGPDYMGFAAAHRRFITDVSASVRASAR